MKGKMNEYLYHMTPLTDEDVSQNTLFNETEVLLPNCGTILAYASL